MQKSTLEYTLAALIITCMAGWVGCDKNTPEPNPTSLDSSQLIEKGEEAFYQSQYEKALKYYQNALKYKPESADLHNRIGMTLRFLYNQNSSEELKVKEIEAFKKAVELDPKFTAAWINLGSACLHADQKKQAAEALKQALELMPSHPDADQIKKLILEAEANQDSKF